MRIINQLTNMVQLIRDLSQKMNCYLTTAELEHRVFVKFKQHEQMSGF